MYEDKTLTCQDCGEEFVFTAGEQEFYAEKEDVEDDILKKDDYQNVNEDEQNMEDNINYVNDNNKNEQNSSS